MRRLILKTILLLVSLIASSIAHAVTFTGHANVDFPASACIDDLGSQDVEFVVNNAIRISGFDLLQLCILYDKGSDTLQVATYTHNATANTDLITGDADGNGNSGSVSADVGSMEDSANFGPHKFFSLILDFDFHVTATNSFDVVAGKNDSNTLADYGVFKTASSNLDNAGHASMYGVAVGETLGTPVPSAPTTVAQPHLEFSIVHLKDIPGFALDLTDPNDAVGVFFSMGSFGPGPLDELFPGTPTNAHIYYGLYPLTTAHLLLIDSDGDGTLDDLDTDDDNDGISDIIEMGLKSCDLNSDGILSVSQDLNFNGVFDAGEEGDILKCSANGFNAGGIDLVRKKAFPGGKYPDYDGDGIPNYLDTDSDNDGVLDKDEDKNGNGIVDPGETDPLNPDTNGNGISDGDELKKYKIDTDNDGLSDGEEIDKYKTDPNNPDTDADGLKDGDEVHLYNTDPLKADTDGGGARDGLEIQRGTNPLDPSDDQKALSDPNSPISGPNTATGTPPAGTDAGTLDPDLTGYTTDQVQVSGSGLASSCSLHGNTDSTSISLWMIIFTLIPLVSLRSLRLQRAKVRKRHHLIAPLLVILFTTLIAPTSAQALDVQLEHLSSNGYGGLYQDNTQMLGQYHWNVAIGFDYTKKPLEVSLISSGKSLDNVVNYFLTQDTVVALGLADWLDISVAVQSNLPSNVEPFGATVATTQADFGDLMVSAKFLLMDAVEQKYGLGLAIIPFATLPTGNSSRYIGNSEMTGGFKVVGERYFGRTDAYMTLGAQFRETENMLNLSVGSSFLFAFGAQHPISTRHDLHVLGEFDGSTVFKKFMHQQNSSPVEMNAGLRKYWLNRHVATTVSVGAGLDNGYGSPQFRAMGSLSFLSHPVKDRDDDHVADPSDYCPSQIADADYPGAKPGCPDPNTRIIVKVVGDRILILQPINFESGSAKILAESTVVVDQVAVVLNKTPELQKILVEGHTDNVGGAALNQKLSDDRAKAVVNALVARGVAPSRLTSRGWGLSKPLTTNATEAGRAKNRRVEFHILEFKAK